MVAECIARHWYRRSALSLLAYPLSLAFSLLVRLRRHLYRAGLLTTVRLPVPVIVVGNLTVGGTGKTPLVLWLVEDLRRAGRHPGILSRGYRGAARFPREVAPTDEATLVGDEPVLLAERGGCPVWVGRDRAGAGAALLAAHPECDVIVCDDGLQHYRLARDTEIAVEDERGAGNGFMLPAGPLREPAGRPVDASVINCGPEDETADGNTTRRASQGASFGMRLEPGGLYPVHDPSRTITVQGLSGKRLHAVAGIGNPGRFFAQLARLGISAACHDFPDHHPYLPQDLEFAGCDAVLMTEKDAVKCRRFGRTDLVALRVDARPDPSLSTFIRNRLHGPTSA